jgi:acyl dehydratase
MSPLSVTRGLYFEDYQIGDSVTSDGRTITEADIVSFAALSGDWNSIHVDAEYAKGTPFGERIAHGLLGLSVATGLAVSLGFMRGTVLAFRSLDWKFAAPIRIGDTIHLRATVAETKAMPRLGGGLVTLDVEIVYQRSEVTQRGAWTVLVKLRG